MIDRRTQGHALFFMDASGTGFGAVTGSDWLAGAWTKDLDSVYDCHTHFCYCPGDEIPDNINVRELYPLVEALWRWGPSWRDRKVICMSDNTQVVAGVNSGKSDNLVAMKILRRIFWLTVLFNCQMVCVHIPGKHNVVADALSRLVESNSKVPVGLCCRCRPVITEVGSESS